MLCEFCNSEVMVINWGSSPIAGYKSDSFEESQKQPIFPLDMMFCPICNYTKYKEYPGMEEIFNKMYYEQEATYSLYNKISDYIENLTSKLIDQYRLTKRSTVLEIGCNDGSMLYTFKNKLECNIIGIEPSKHFNDIWKVKGLNVINEFFTSKTVKEINTSVDVIIIRHVLEHISDVKTMIENISTLMDENSVLIIEVPYLISVLQNRRLENISHPHLNCFSIRSINKVISNYDLGISEYKLVDTDGGSILFHIKKGIKTEETLLDTTLENDFVKLQHYLEDRKLRIDQILQKYKQDEVVGAGAGAKGPHLIYLFGLDRYINTVFDIHKSFVNKYIPRTNIVIKEENYSNSKLKAVINLAPTHYSKIRTKVPDHIEVINIIEEINN